MYMKHPEQANSRDRLVVTDGLVGEGMMVSDC